MPINDKIRHDRREAKKARRIRRQNKIASKKKSYINKPTMSTEFNRCAWNNSNIRKSHGEVLNKKKIGFDKQAWTNGGT